MKMSILLGLRYPEEVEEGEHDLDEEVVLGEAPGRGRAVPDRDGHVVLVRSSSLTAAAPAPLGRVTGVLLAASAGFDPEGAPEVLPEEHEDERVEHCHWRRGRGSEFTYFHPRPL